MATIGVPKHDGPPAYRQPIDAVVAALQTDLRAGLSDAEASARLARHGPNELQAEAPVPAWKRFLAQFKDVLVILLLIATVISAGLWLMERESPLPYEALAIFAVVMLNAVLGFVQQSRAASAVAELRKMSAAHAHVIRGGQRRQVPAAEVVPGDVMIVEEGDTIPADARVVHSTALQTAESALTGESLPVSKDTLPIDAEAPLGDRHNMVFSGTAATYGRGKAVVVATGMQTEMGRIAGTVERNADREHPPAKGARPRRQAPRRRCRGHRDRDDRHHHRRREGPGVGRALRGPHPWSRARRRGGPRRPASGGDRRAFARRPEGSAAQRDRPPPVRRRTLGSASVIASDKTGTLTKNEMTVRMVVTASGQVRFDGTGYAPQGDVRREGGGAIDGPLRVEFTRTLAAADRANNAVLQEKDGRWTVQGDPTEGALIVAALKAGLTEDALSARFARLAEVPFSSERKLMSTIHSDAENRERARAHEGGARRPPRAVHAGAGRRRDEAAR